MEEVIDAADLVLDGPVVCSDICRVLMGSGVPGSENASTFIPVKPYTSPPETMALACLMTWIQAYINAWSYRIESRNFLAPNGIGVGGKEAARL